ncbi:NYN domain-containing protein [Flavitalea sp. BT771]|uniref:NYN domain-containing protein n=1 Tax=Flavitalea sp. BT771 TaxID=3063329 RepID=UPI0026E31C03|nr:NYN domain-containing protein [Flavitalea sp. BT771]MDO6429197.1 NYN domain-containing protein [Flavitalea sp. BT771]MDV6218675.1 NYN domain-containing protein [Flavitalea sp. BT771]
MKPTVAVLIDGGFFLKRYYDLYKGSETHNAETIAKNICRAAMKHVSVKHELYRIFYYDCSPLDKRVHNPISGKCIDFKKTEVYKLRLQLFEELKKKRKVALRLGQISDFGSWQIYPSKVKALLKGEIALKDIREIDVFYEMRQKGIDMKIGVDIASLALKKQVNQIVLVSGDEDFVPASKLARREGIDFILDPLWNHVNANLFEHIDGLNSTSPKPTKK